MPKYQKNAQIQVWRNTDGYQDDTGGWHEGHPYHMVTLWAYASGRDFSEQHGASTIWVAPAMSFTVTRPRDENVPEVGDHVLYRLQWFEIKTINLLTDTPGRDMRLICERDDEYEA